MKKAPKSDAQKRQAWQEVQRYVGMLEYSYIAGLRKRVPPNDPEFQTMLFQLEQACQWMKQAAADRVALFDQKSRRSAK